MIFRFLSKNIFFFSVLLVILGLLLYKYSFEKEEVKKEIQIIPIGEEIQLTEFIQGKKNYEMIHPQGRLLHNNGKPIKNNVISNEGDQKLFAVFQIFINEADYESYIFSSLDSMSMDEIRSKALEDKEKALEITSTNRDTINISGETTINGYVMDKKGQEILIVSPVAKDYSKQGGTEEFYDAVWANNSPENVKVGKQVKVWFAGGVTTSYPGHGSIGNLEIIPDSIPEGATLSNAEVLNKALNKNTYGNEIVTVQSISYDAAKDIWTIILKNTDSFEKQTVQVEDK